MEKVRQFVTKHLLSAREINMNELVNHLLSEMTAGLEGQDSSLLMLPTFLEADKPLPPGHPVIAVDAGGTNFRMAKMYMNEDLEMVTEKLDCTQMPAVDQELSKQQFFEVMASSLKSFREYSNKIGFCFSYAVEILPDKDGKLLEWSKEVKAPEVIGEMIGKNLLHAMNAPEKKVILLNDTAATLLAGKAAMKDKKYDSYIGFILGTGMNTCYIESNKNILKISGADPGKNQIINTESGNFGKIQQTDIDRLFDSRTESPGNGIFEKMCAGGYLGGLISTALKVAAGEGIFSREATINLNRMKDLTTEEVNAFVSRPVPNNNPLNDILISGEDKTAAGIIIETLIERGAKLVAANLAAVLLKTGKGKSTGKPVLITIEGTTYYKLKNFPGMCNNFLMEFLSGKNKRHVEMVQVKNSSLTGAAIAAIMN